MRRSKVFGILAISMGLVAGCGPADDRDAVHAMNEAEPNDLPGSANEIGGSGFYFVRGYCAVGETADWFRGTGRSGTLEVYFGVAPPPDPDDGGDAFAAATASVAVLDGQQQVLAEEDSIGQGQSAEFRVAVGSQMFVRIGCPEDSALSYTATIRIP